MVFGSVAWVLVDAQSRTGATDKLIRGPHNLARLKLLDCRNGIHVPDYITFKSDCDTGCASRCPTRMIPKFDRLLWNAKLPDARGQEAHHETSVLSAT